MHVILRWCINAVALLAAAFVVPGIHLSASGRAGFNEWVTLAIVAATTLIYAPPLVYGSPLAYDSAGYDPYASYSPPVSYGPNMGGAISLAPSPPPSPPTVVEFPTGRYELRGDGMATPYTWVWIPNPPSAPPTQAPDPPDPPASSHRQLYRWTDEAGVAHWTDRGDAVPEQYRAQAQPPRLR